MAAAGKKLSSTNCTSERLRQPELLPQLRERLDYLADIGITALEIMPVADFPGKRNWGYDGVFPFRSR